MDKRYTCWLTEDGVRVFTRQRNELIHSKLPELRRVPGTVDQRKALLKRVLWLNQHLNYNANEMSREVQEKVERGKFDIQEDTHG